MVFSSITLGSNVQIDPSTSFNNVWIGNNVKIAKNCSIYGSAKHPLHISSGCYVAMGSILNGFAAPLRLGERVSIAQNVHLMTDSGPNASPLMQMLFPLEEGPITIGDDCWIGASSIVMPNVELGECSVVAANSFVNKSFPAYSVLGGNPARLLRTLDPSTVEEMRQRLTERGP